MGVNFCLSKTRSASNATPWTYGEARRLPHVIKNMIDCDGMSYCCFNMARANILSHFSEEFGLAYNMAALHGTQEVEKALKYYSHLIPNTVLEFCMKPDCDGWLTPRMCKSFAKEIGDGFSSFVPLKWCKTGDKENTLLRLDTHAYNAEYVVNGIIEAARKNLYFVWH